MTKSLGVRPKLRHGEVQTLCRLFNEGKGPKAIAAIMGRAPKTIALHLDRYGLREIKRREIVEGTKVCEAVFQKEQNPIMKKYQSMPLMVRV